MKAMTLLFITLLLVATLSQATRPTPKEANSVKGVEGVAVLENNYKADEEDSGTTTSEVLYCEGVSEKECLMRRTLVAHTDYIYTQRDHHKH